MVRSTARTRGRLRLRTRTAVALALGGLAGSVVLGLLSYQLTRGYLLDRRVGLAEREAFVNAVYLDRALGPDDPVPDLLRGIATPGSPVLVQVDDRWYGTVVDLGRRDVPADLSSSLAAAPAASVLTARDGAPTVVVGVELPNAGARLYQFFPLIDLPATLGAVRTSLVIGAVAATVAAAAFGLLISRRVLRPLRETAETAERIAAGDLGARLAVSGDPDLEPLSGSFNEMVAALDARIARERRFAADVSHELRTPLTSMTSAVHVLDRRAGELGPSGQEALRVLHSQVEQFTRLVLEILELARLESGTADVRRAAVDVAATVRAIAAECGVGDDVLHVGRSLPRRAELDVVRLRLVVRNLVENAERYGGGCTAVRARAAAGELVLEVDDAGPGVPPEDRERVFEPFHRGTGRSAGGPKGTGLGLALVRESVRALGGRVVIGDAPGGGARFTVGVPITAAAEPDGADDALGRAPA